MACPTCSHTMRRVAESVYWCPRCGTLSPNYEAPDVPTLVEHCRAFNRMVDGTGAGRALKADLVASGVMESILRPESRP